MNKRGCIIAIFALLFLIPLATASGNDDYTKLLLHFDGDFEDSSSYSSSVTNNGASFSVGKFGQSATFQTAQGDNLNFGNSDNFNLKVNEDYTVDFWLNMGTEPPNGNYQGLVGKRESTGSGYGWALYYFNSTTKSLQLYVWDESQWLILGYDIGTYPTDWHHVALVKKDREIFLYWDGVKSSSSIKPSSIYSSTGNFYAGYDGWGNYFLDGNMDELRVSKGIARWEDDFTPPNSEYYWGPSFRNGTTDNPYLLQSNNVNDVFVYNTSNETGLWKVGGNIGKCAMSFDGSGDYITQTSLSPSLSSNLSVSVWFKTENKQPDGYPDRILDLAQSGDIGLQITYYRGRIVVDNSGGPTSGIGSSFDYADGAWHNVVTTRDASTNTYYMYVDGEYIGSSDGTSPTYTRLFVGARSDLTETLYFNGSIDEIQIFNRSLSSAEISSIYNRGLSNLKSNITSGLVGAWGFDDCVSSGDTVDESGNSNDGTLNGGALSEEKLSWFKEGNMNEMGAYFDGDGDYINVSDTYVYTAYTISAWVKPADVSTARNIIVRTNHNGPSIAYSHALQINPDGKFLHYNYDGAAKTVTGTKILNPNQWYYVVGVAENSGDMRLYVNGIEEGTSQTIGTLWEGGTKWMFGPEASGAINAPDYWNGSIDEVRIFNEALTSSEIKDLYTRELANADTSVYDNDASLVGFWDFENSSDWYADKSGEGNDGTAVGDVSISMVDYLQDDGAAASVYDQAAVFDGEDDYVDITDDSSFGGLTSLTLSAWINPASLQDGGIISQGNYQSGYIWPFYFVFREYQNVQFQVYETTGSSPGASTMLISDTIPLNSWTYVVGTWTANGDIKLYVNGIEQDSAATTINDLPDVAYNVAVGRLRNDQYGHAYFDGKIDEAKVYSRVLTPQEINDSYQRGLQGLLSNVSTTSLVSYWSFNGDYDDDSGNGNDGTAVNDVYLYGRTGNKEFPDKAYLVATDEGLDVIDSVDDSLWMRFKEGGVSPFTSNGNILSTLEGTGSAKWGSVTANKGAFYLGNSINWAAGLYRIDFIEEESYIYRNSGNNNYLYSSNIDDRNNRKGFTSSTSRPYIIGIPVNDVSVAEINGNTYVAVATDGGVSVINESGNSVTHFGNDSQIGTNVDITQVVLLSNGDAYFGHVNTDASNYRVDSYYNIINDATETAIFEHRNMNYNDLTTPSMTPGLVNDLYVTSGTSTVDSTSNTIYVATDAGVSVIQEKQGDESNGNVENYVTGPGKVSGQALILDGDGDYVHDTTSDYRSSDQQGTISAWVKTTQTNERILTSADEATSDYYIMMGTDASGYLSFQKSPDGGYITYGDDIITDGEWHHVAVISDGTEYTFYVDNVLQTLSEQSGGAGTNNGDWFADVPNRDNIVIGALNRSVGSQSFWNGSIDEVRVYDKALNSSEVTQLYNKQSVTDSLVSYWNFDEDYTDQAGSNDGTKQGDTFLAYPVIGGSSNNVTSIEATSYPLMYIGTEDGISLVDIHKNILLDHFNISENPRLLDYHISSLSTGSLMYGTEDSGAGVLDEGPITPLDISGEMTTMIGSGGPLSWSWNSSESEGLVRCGNAQYWEWKTYSECNQKVPNGTATDWKWVEK